MKMPVDKSVPTEDEEQRVRAHNRWSVSIDQAKAAVRLPLLVHHDEQ
jgi:hypothetical protein